MIRRFLAALFAAICHLFRKFPAPDPARRMLELTNNLDVYPGNNSTETGYPITFRFDANSWLYVQREDALGNVTPLALGVDYTLTGSGKLTTAVLKTIEAVPYADKLVIYRYAPAVQLFHPESNQPLDGVEIERMQDQIIMAMQDRDPSPGIRGSRALFLPPSEPAENPHILPVPALRKGKFMAGDPVTGAVGFFPVQDFAPLFLALWGGAPTSADVLAAATSLGALVLDTPPTAATPGNFGQLALLPGSILLNPENTDPILTPLYGHSAAELNERISQYLVEAGEATGYNVWSNDGINPGGSFPIPPSQHFWLYVRYVGNFNGNTINDLRWVIGLSVNGIHIFLWVSETMADSPDNLTWEALDSVVNGTVSLRLQPTLVYINLSRTTVPRWTRIMTLADFHPNALLTTDPAVAGRLFLDGTALNVSNG